MEDSSTLKAFKIKYWVKGNIRNAGIAIMSELEVVPVALFVEDYLRCFDKRRSEEPSGERWSYFRLRYGGQKPRTKKRGDVEGLAAKENQDVFGAAAVPHIEL